MVAGKLWEVEIDGVKRYAVADDIGAAAELANEEGGYSSWEPATIQSARFVGEVSVGRSWLMCAGDKERRAAR